MTRCDHFDTGLVVGEHAGVLNGDRVIRGSGLIISCQGSFEEIGYRLRCEPFLGGARTLLRAGDDRSFYGLIGGATNSHNPLICPPIEVSFACGIIIP